MGSKCTIVAGDDWIGIYVEDSLITEGHTIPLLTAMNLVLEHSVERGAIERVNANLDWLHDMGSLPQDLDKVVLEGQPYEPYNLDEPAC